MADQGFLTYPGLCCGGDGQSWCLSDSQGPAKGPRFQSPEDKQTDCFSQVPTNGFGEKLREQVEERLSFYDTGEIPRKHLEVRKETMVQAEDTAAAITRKVEKQEEKCLKKEKKRLAAIALASSENSRRTPGSVRRQVKDSKRRKSKSSRGPQENGMEDPLVSIQTQEKEIFFKGEAG
ncbi:hypothetical protein mRhiFer1_008353 [Rhinolophus ferrumequinum]|uniref:Uncharacterized protein n=1 Tax=Rhinolophus ferrumequinum TaxID=59479 RepID=A0A7J7VEC4_RHIFE|nr:hypothetical protein mRhiFer1_008353 [Rhinolophus ferrumequinum]